MKGSSHFITGALVTTVIIGEFSGNRDLLLLTPYALLGGAAALLPDLDAKQSVIKYFTVKTPWRSLQPLRFLSRLIHAGFGHRGAWHSLMALVILFFLAAPLWALGYPWMFLAIVVGFSMHLFTDALTKMGIPFLYPRTFRMSLLPRELRITTGGLAEYIFVAFVCIGTLLWYIN